MIALAVFPGWLQPVLVVGLISALELAMYLGVEPWLYGQGAGISEVALLIAIAFWTWLWGPVGLLLATPVTVCLAVLSKYAPALWPVAVLIDGEPDARPSDISRQGLLSTEDHEARRSAGECPEQRSRRCPNGRSSRASTRARPA
jgi:hypothetical protein